MDRAGAASHRAERTLLERRQAKRWQVETADRKSRFKTGIAGLWQKISGKHAQLAAENELLAYTALKRDQAQKQSISEAQLGERRKLETERAALRKEAFGLISDMRSEQGALIKKLTQPQSIPRKRRIKQQIEQHIDHGPDLSI
ncbi:MAG: hypothetical protein ACSHXB_20755 [Sulfitobacter sp.]